LVPFFLPRGELGGKSALDLIDLVHQEAAEVLSSVLDYSRRGTFGFKLPCALEGGYDLSVYYFCHLESLWAG